MTDTDISTRLLRWFDRHGRKDLPWQQRPTPYRVWVSEIMLQQTQWATVIPYYLRFMGRFPELGDLAAASLDDVLHQWSGLGYYARARNLHRAAGVVCDRHGGVFPDTFDAVAALPGIGRSTAGAILSLAFGQRQPILDGNAKRALARHYAIAGWPGKSRVANRLWELADRNTPVARVADYTQAIMDLGATVCVRRNPACERCPLVDTCAAHRLGDVHAYPSVKPRTRKPQKRTHMLLVIAEESLYLERRPPQGIWGGLWSLPELQSADELPLWCERTLGSAPGEIKRLELVRHSFSHYDLDITPLEVRLKNGSRKVADRDGIRWHTLAEPLSVGLAAPVKAIVASRLALQTSEMTS